jgi:ABC transport system ATP-binding/permease protein
MDLPRFRAYLLGEVEPFRGQKIHLNKPQFVVGRDERSCDMVLNQSFVSRRHAAFETDETGRTTLKDLGSKFGTFVNGTAVSEQVLVDGDRVGLGPDGAVSFRFSQTARKPVAEPEETMWARSQSPVSAEASAAGRPPVPASSEAPATKRYTVGAKSVLRLGRAPDNDIILNGPGVSRHHATLTYRGGDQPILEDLGSTNGTYVNGNLLRSPRLLDPNDLVFLGGFLVRIDGRKVRQDDLSSSRIRAEGITQEVGDKTLLKDITLALLPGEFVGLMGPSGCGKSVLMNALNGLRPASGGFVYLNDLDLRQHFKAIQRSIGYVPQRDVLHEVLSVERTLLYAARLRLPEDTPRSEVRRVVEEVIQTVGLKDQRTNQFRQLSGGQQKRLSLGIELITKPSFLFLDEPTSPLDPATTEEMMVLFRQLADQGRIVVMVTHKSERFYTMHQVVILARHGRLAFFGPPKAALEYFGCTEPAQIYLQLGKTTPDELSRRFESSPQREIYVKRRLEQTRALSEGAKDNAAPATTGGATSTRRASLLNLWTLTCRCLEIKLRDRRNTFLLLAQAPLVALILVLITGHKLNDAKALFISAIIAGWFGANNAVREIVAEFPIYERERRYNLKIPTYVISRFVVLSLIGLIQSYLFLGVLIGFKLLSRDDLVPLLAILFLTTLGGISTGLFFSALVNSTEKAMTVLPLILIPQLLLSGFFKPVDTFYVNLRTGRPATAAAYRKFEDAKTGATPRPAGAAPGALREAPQDPIAKYEGLGPIQPLSALVMARWSIDGLVHAVSLDDNATRDQLASQLYVHSYARVLEGQSDSAIQESYRRRVWMDLTILAGFSLSFLGLTMWALKRKDIL